MKRYRSTRLNTDEAESAAEEIPRTGENAAEEPVQTGKIGAETEEEVESGMGLSGDVNLNEEVLDDIRDLDEEMSDDIQDVDEDDSEARALEELETVAVADMME